MNLIYHVGFIVPSLEEAMAAYSRALGLTFLPPVARSYHRIEQRSCDGPASGRLTYSIEGPVHVELMETSGKGILAPQPGEGLHHVGMWAKDPLGQAKEMAADGFAWEASTYAQNGSVPMVYVRRGSVLVELVGEARRKDFADWIGGIRDPY